MHHDSRHRRFTRPVTCIICALLAVPGTSPGAGQAIHLLGFVERLCGAESHCFDLRVKPAYQALAGERIRVHFDSETQLFDPENFQLTLEQQNIGAGSHLRLLIRPDAGGDAFRAEFIWIGD